MEFYEKHFKICLNLLCNVSAYEYASHLQKLFQFSTDFTQIKVIYYFKGYDYNVCAK